MLISDTFKNPTSTQPTTAPGRIKIEDTFRGVQSPAGTDPASKAVSSTLEDLVNPSKHPILSGLWGLAKGVGDIVAQPARAVQSLGTGIGDLAAQNIPLPYAKEAASALGFTKENAPAVKQALESGPINKIIGEAPPTHSIEQGAGQLLQAGANLATPFVLSASPFWFGEAAAFGAQSAALSAGKAMEEEKSSKDVAMEGGKGAVIGAALGLAGKAISTKAAEQAIFRKFSGLTKEEADWGIKNAETIAGHFKEIMTGVKKGDLEGAKTAIKQRLSGWNQQLKDFEAGVQASKDRTLFRSTAKAVEDAKPGISVDRSAFRQEANKIFKGTFATNQDGEVAIASMKRLKDNWTDFSPTGLLNFRDELLAIAKNIPSGSSERVLNQKLLDLAKDKLMGMVRETGAIGSETPMKLLDEELAKERTRLLDQTKGLGIAQKLIEKVTNADKPIEGKVLSTILGLASGVGSGIFTGNPLTGGGIGIAVSGAGLMGGVLAKAWREVVNPERLLGIFEKMSAKGLSPTETEKKLLTELIQSPSMAQAVGTEALMRGWDEGKIQDAVLGVLGF